MKAVLICIVLLAAFPAAHAQKHSLVNFAHLEHLTEEIDFAGEKAGIVHVYSNYPDYRWVGAEESGPEGIACVDDAARAAVLYLRHFELTNDTRSRQKALLLLRFVVNMQTGDGEFYNFIFSDHSVNASGQTSFKSFGWWGARGLWAMAAGSRVLSGTDSSFAMLLRERVARALPHIERLLKKYGEFQIVNGYRVPLWLLYESGTDVTSELLFGLIEYYRITSDPSIRSMLTTLSEGLMMMQDGDVKHFPFGLHRSWKTEWHMWGNGQTQALASAGKLLRAAGMVHSAELEATGFYSRLLIQGFLKEMDVAGSRRTAFDQIAYGVRPMSVGLIRLYEATGDSTYLAMAGLAASWLFGNNASGIEMYDASTGRCYDGIRDSVTVNKNAGAESTIEALSTLVELEQYPYAAKFLHFRKVREIPATNQISGCFRNDAGDTLTLTLDLETERVGLTTGWNRIQK